MLITIPKVLNADQLKAIRAALADARFVDGRLTAGTLAGPVKNNEELDRSTEGLQKLNEIVIGTLCQQRTFRAAALPASVSRAFFARYGPGMSYGWHVDDPVSKDNQNRADIAMTVFLSDVDEYDGGELVVRTTFGEQAIKLPAGDVVIYPSSSLHQVREVTRGQRLVAVAWTQSLVRDPARRELLYELDFAREESISSGARREITDGLEKVYANLLRMWADT
ncbi:MAG: Fe2+-dependent dioxygenase [Gammaproteobacteria bacterium]|nr:Fe2+-dependent dioxygenase [Gammaproteobacteria bacterium]